MLDHQLRGLILRRYYDARRKKWSQLEWNPADFDGLVDALDFSRISIVLAEYGLIDYYPAEGTDEWGQPGSGQITAEGIDVVEGQNEPPIAYLGTRATEKIY